MAMWTYAMSQGARCRRGKQAFGMTLIAAADEIANRSSNNGYRISLTNRDYIWGSNGVLANYGMELLIAGRAVEQCAIP